MKNLRNIFFGGWAHGRRREKARFCIFNFVEDTLVLKILQ